MIWTVRAGCKVNLYLDIIGVREDGYHEIESLFYPLPEPCDVLRIENRAEPGLVLSCSIPTLATGTNIVAKAYDRFTSKTGFAPGLSVHLDKNIPMGAGLGGGSSDAAVFLRWLNDQAGAAALDETALCDVAVSLGADVPFFLQNRPAWVTGIGERVCGIDLDLTAFTLVLVCPDVHVDTKWAYARWDAVHGDILMGGRKPLTGAARPNKNLCFTNPSEFRNTFEDVIFPDFPVLYDVKQSLLQSGAVACVMSGSGSSLVAVFSSRISADQGVDLVRGWGMRCYVVSLTEGFSA